MEPGWRNRLLYPGLLSLSLLVIIGIKALPIISQGKLILGSDLILQYLPRRVFMAQWLKAGVIPLWNPHIFCGVPFIAGLLTSIGYPLTWLYLFISPYQASNLVILLHTYLSGIFFYTLCRHYRLSVGACFIASHVYAFSGYWAGHLLYGHLVNLATYALAPLVILLFERLLSSRRLKQILQMAGVLFLFINGGHPQYIFYTFYLLLFIFVHATFRRKLGFKDAALILLPFFMAALLCACLLIPGAELTEHTLRTGALDQDVLMVSPFQWENFITFLHPRHLGTPIDDDYRSKGYFGDLYCYLGIPGLIMLLAGLACFNGSRLNVYRFGLLFSVLMMLGDNFPYLSDLLWSLPGVAHFRGPSRWLYVFTIAAAIIIAELLDRLQDSLRAANRAGLFWLAALTMALIPPAIILCPNHSLSLSNRPFFELLLLLAALGCIFIAIRESKKIAVFIAIALFYLLCVYSLSENTRYVQQANTGAIDYMSELDDFIADQSGHQRYYYLNQMYSNLGMIYGISNAGGYSSSLLSRFNALVNLAQGREMSGFGVSYDLLRPPWLLDYLGARYFIADISTPSHPPMEDHNLSLTYQQRHYRVYENKGALPLAFMASRFAITDDGRISLLQLSQITSSCGEYAVFSLSSQAMLDNHRDIDIVDSNSALPGIELQMVDPNRFSLSINAPYPGALVILNSYFPGWILELNQRIVPLARANYLFMGAIVEPGSYEGSLYYQPFSFSLGLYLSLVTVALVLIVWLVLVFS